VPNSFSMNSTILLIVLVCVVPAISEDVPGHCRKAHQDWLGAFNQFKAGIQDYRQLKEESITPRIEEEMKGREGRPPIAAIVRTVLQERDRRLSQAGKELEKLLALEKDSFDRWKVCSSQGRRRSQAHSRSDPEIVERDRLSAQCKDLLLDETFEQYRNYRAPVPSDYSYYGPGPYPRSQFPEQSAPGGYGERWGRFGYGPR